MEREKEMKRKVLILLICGIFLASCSVKTADKGNGEKADVSSSKEVTKNDNKSEEEKNSEEVNNEE